MSREYPRKLRVAAELQRVANELLTHEINDPCLADVRISAVELSGDLSVARLYYNALDPDADPGPIESGFERASGFFRARLGRAVRMRRVPELRFAQDLGPRRGLELSQLIDEAVEVDRRGEEDEATPQE